MDEDKKKQNELSAKTGQAVTKVIQMRRDINEEDWQVKHDHAIKFLKGGDLVKVNMHMRGREVVHPEQSAVVLIRFVEELKDHCKYELPPVRVENILYLILTPIQL